MKIFIVFTDYGPYEGLALESVWETEELANARVEKLRTPSDGNTWMLNDYVVQDHQVLSEAL